MVANYTMQRGLEAVENRDGSIMATVEEMKSKFHWFKYWDGDYLLSYPKNRLVAAGRPIPLDLQSEKYD